MLRLFRTILTVSITVLLLSCSLIEPQNETYPIPELSYKSQAYVIGVTDQLRVDVWRNDDLTRNVVVRPDGFITMPLMGDILAEGRTPEQLAQVINDALTSVIKTPEVTVTVVNPASIAFQFRVRAMGQVNQPVSVAFSDGMTVMDLLLQAGGISPFGAGNRAVLSRLTEEGYKEYPLKLEDMLEHGDISTNYKLQPADVITIPERNFWLGEF